MFYNSFLVLLFISHAFYVLFTECPSFIFCDFIFYNKVALQQIVTRWKCLQQRRSPWKYQTHDFSCPGVLVHADRLPGAPHLVQGWFRFPLASPGPPFLSLHIALYFSSLGPHQPVRSRTAGMISYSPCNPSVRRRCSVNVSLKGTQTELGDA